MSSHRRGRRVVFAAGLATILVAALNPPAAQAETGAPTLTRARNASDPFVLPCFGALGQQAICMYTSSDLGEGGQDTYPMDTTYLYTMDTNPALDRNPGDPQSWSTGSAVFTESTLDWVQPGRKHLWAPAATGGGDGHYYLYVPDVRRDNDQDPKNDISNIAVARSETPNPWGPFRSSQRITYKGQVITDYYMSDPMVFQSMGDHPGDPEPPIVDGTPRPRPSLESRKNGPARWLLWANGYWETCGRLSIALLDDVSMSEIYTDPRPSVSEIRFEGTFVRQTGPDGQPQIVETNTMSQDLGTCQGSSLPYLEDPNLYFTPPWGFTLGTNYDDPRTPQDDRVSGRPYLLVFAAKPASRNQVIAYASATNPRGPYRYEGILMEASNTSWTNQSSLYWDWANNGDLRGIVFYHDDASTTGDHHRKVYANCLTFDLSDSKFVPVTRPSTLPNLRNCPGLRP